MYVIAARELLLFSRHTRCISKDFGEVEIFKTPLSGTIRPSISILCKLQTDPQPKLGTMNADRIFFKANTVIGSVAIYRLDRFFMQS